MNLGIRAQRLVVLGALLCGVGAGTGAIPFAPTDVEAAHALMPDCDRASTDLNGLVTGNTLMLGNGTSVTPCIPHAPIHMRIGYSDGTNGGSIAGGTTQFTTDGITFPDGKFIRRNTGCGAFSRTDSTIAKPTILQFADGTQSAGPSNVTTYASWGAFGSCPSNGHTLYGDNAWSTAFSQSDNAMLVHMRLKNLQILRNGYMTVVPQSNPAAPVVAGTGEYGLTFTPASQGSVNWNIGDSCVFTDLWLRADTHIKVNIFGINTSVGALAGDDSLWGSILSSIATGDDIPGLEMDGWVYYMNTNKGSCTGTPTTLNLPNTIIGVTP